MVSGESRVLAPPTRPQVTQQTPAVAATLAAAYRLTDGRGRTSSCLLQNTAQLQGLTDWSVWLSHNYYYYYHNKFRTAQTFLLESSEKVQLENSTQRFVQSADFG